MSYMYSVRVTCAALVNTSTHPGQATHAATLEAPVVQSCMSNAGCFAVDVHHRAWWCESPTNAPQFTRLPLADVHAITAGDTTACALDVASSGVIRKHETTWTPLPAQSAQPAQPSFTVIASGSSHCCAVSNVGEVWVQGWGLQGALGLGVLQDSPQFQLVRCLGTC